MLNDSNVFADVLYDNDLCFRREATDEGTNFTVFLPISDNQPPLPVTFSVSNNGNCTISCRLCQVIPENMDIGYLCINAANSCLSHGHLILDGTTVFLKGGFLLRTCDGENSEYLLNQYLSLFTKVLVDAKTALMNSEAKFMKEQEES